MTTREQDATPPTVSVHGLSAAQVAERRAEGRVNVVGARASRTVGDIVRANVFTRFNLLLGSLLVVVLLVAPIQDAAFGFVLVANTAVGIVQEVRAKRTLDRLAVLSAPHVRVVRDGRELEVAVEEVVADDLVVLAPGDQLVVDGVVVDADGLELDESLLTGESDPVPRAVGETCLSGSFVVAGRGWYWATKVGPDAYAARLAEQAREFTLTRSELRAGVDRLLQVISWLLVVMIPLLAWTQLRASPGIRHAAAGAVAGSVAMIPEGLVLLTSVAFAVSVVRLGSRNVLVQELAAVEGLARVDTVCFDKTGTLTVGELRVEDVVRLDGVGDDEVRAALGALVACEPDPNATLRAVAEAGEDPGWELSGRVPFTSARRWSGATFAGRGTYLLGAPERLLAATGPGHDVVRRATGDGARVVVLARSDEVLGGHGDQGPDVPPRLAAIAIVVIADQLRADAADTLAYFRDQGVTAKVISGDHPATVGAIAARAGLDGADRAMAGEDLPEAPDALAELLETHHVFGRVSPQRKQAIVRALQSRGHVIAMTGDGVNDVLALKDADIGLAMGSGSGATRSVAQVVLLDSSFGAVPEIVGEGRRVIANIERVASLFVTKTVYAFLLALAVGIAGLVFPFLPRHLTLVGSLTIGIPAFFLALEGDAHRSRPGFLRRVLLFALPTGGVAAAATFLTYWLARLEGATTADSRTLATLVLGTVGLYALALVCRTWTPLRRVVMGSMVSLFVLAFLVPGSRSFFALTFPRPVLVLAAVGVAGLTGAAMLSALRAVGWARRVSLDDVTTVTTHAVARSRRLVRDTWRSLRGPGSR